MSDSGFDTPRPKDPKLSFQAWMSGLAAVALLTACQIEARFSKSPIPSPSTTSTATETPLPTLTPIPEGKQDEVIRDLTFATATAEASTGALTKELPQITIDSAFQLTVIDSFLGINCSGNLVGIQDLTQNLHILTFYTAGHCFEGLDFSLNIGGFVNQPHKDEQRMQILKAKAEWINEYPEKELDFGVISVLVSDDVSKLHPLTDDQIAPGNMDISPGDNTYGLAFPGTNQDIQPLVGAVYKVTSINTIIVKYPSIGGSSGTGMFTDNKLTHIHKGGNWDQVTGPWEAFFPIPENHKEYVEKTTESLKGELIDVLPLPISPEVAVEILNSELLPSLMNTSCTTYDSEGKLLDFRYASFMLKPNDTRRPDVAYLLDPQECVTKGRWEDVDISNPANPTFSYSTHHATFDGQACSNSFFCGLIDNKGTLRSEFPAISIDKISKPLPYFTEGDIYTLSFDGSFRQSNYFMGMLPLDTQPGSPIVSFTQDGWKIIGLYLNANDGSRIFDEHIHNNLQNAFDEIDKNLVK